MDLTIIDASPGFYEKQGGGSIPKTEGPAQQTKSLASIKSIEVFPEKSREKLRASFSNKSE